MSTTSTTSDDGSTQNPLSSIHEAESKAEQIISTAEEAGIQSEIDDKQKIDQDVNTQKEDATTQTREHIKQYKEEKTKEFKEQRKKLDDSVKQLIGKAKTNSKQTANLIKDKFVEFFQLSTKKQAE